MKKAINTLSSDKIILTSTLLSLLFLVISIGCIGIFFPRLPVYIPLFHQLPWGIGRLGAKSELFLPNLYVLLLIILNTVFAYRIYGKMPLVSRIIEITNLLLSFILLLYTIRTIQLVL